MKSYSQAGQDLFALAMTEGKTNGFFLDIGCNDAKFHSNTFALEELGWSGLMVDIVGGCEARKGTFVKCDAAKPDERLRFQYSQMAEVVDYLSLDVDDVLVPVLQAIPFGVHTFRVITLEHDVYCRGVHPQWASRTLLSSLGYHLLCADVKVVPPGMTTWEPYEDWWCSPELVNPELVKQYQCDGKQWSDILK
jgi:hypothetical protein